MVKKKFICSTIKFTQSTSRLLNSCLRVVYNWNLGPNKEQLVAHGLQFQNMERAVARPDWGELAQFIPRDAIVIVTSFSIVELFSSLLRIAFVCEL